MNVRFAHPVAGELLVAVGPAGITVGRSGGNVDVELNSDARLSRRHARLWRDEDGLWIEDLGSSNGTWLDGARLNAPQRLGQGLRVLLGETSVTLVEVGTAPAEDPELPSGMTLQMRGRTDGRWSDMLGGADLQTYMAALCEFAQGLLETTSRDLIPRALRRVYEVVPAAQRISLVAWPPDPELGFQPLVPTEEGLESGPISHSLARHAVETGQALLISDEVQAEALEAGASVKRHGIRSAVYVPMVAQDGEAVGLLCVDTPTPSLPFSPEDFHFIRGVGALLASALAAERLREEARRAEVEARRVEARREAMVGFLGIASHDLRNPLALIQMGAQMLRGPAPTTARGELLEMIEHGARAGLDLIATYLEVAAIESGRTVKLAVQPLDPWKVVESELSFLKAGLSNNRAGLYEFENRVECRQVLADPMKFRQIISNLVSNAAKYSPDGGRIQVSSREEDGEVVFSVRDEGVGISAEDREKLFRQFERVGEMTLASGTGLGLWISSVLVQVHGGRIGVESEPGRGSTFWFSLPAAPAPPSPPPGPAAGPGPDDN